MIKTLRDYLPIMGVFALALLVRFIYNVTVARGYVPAFDANYYHTIARYLVDEHCYCMAPHAPNSNRAPLWPLIMAAIYFVTGPVNLYARLFYCLLGSFTCVLIYLLARELFGKRIGLTTGIIAAVYTGLFIYDGWLYTESLYTFCSTAFIYGLFRLQRTALPVGLIANNLYLTLWLHGLQRAARRRWSIFCGLSIALATLTRPNGIALLGLIACWAIMIILARVLPWRTVLGNSLLILFVGIALITPWTYRNYRVTHTFIPVATGLGNVLSGVYNDTALQDNRMGRGMWMPMDLIKPPIQFHGHSCCNYTGEQDNIDYALHWIRSHPGAMPYLLGLHFVNMWQPYTSEEGLPVREFPTRLSSQVVWDLMWTMPIPIFLLATLGLFATWSRYKKQLIGTYLLIVLTVLQNIALYGSSRFRAPIEPLLVLLAGGALWWLFSKEPGTLRNRSTRQEVPADTQQEREAVPTVSAGR